MVFAAELYSDIKNIFFGVSSKPSLLWQVIPLVILWIILEIYFGRYKDEKLGWNTALGNGISMFWVVISAFQFIFSNEQNLDLTWNFFVAIFLIASYSGFIIYVSFKHALKSKFTYLLASPTPIYYFSIIALLIAHQVIIISLISSIAIIVVLALLSLLFFMIRLLIPRGDDQGDQDDDKHSFKENFSFKEPSFDSSQTDGFNLDKTSDLENNLDSTFSSKSDPFSNDFGSTAKPNDVLMDNPRANNKANFNSFRKF